MDLTYLEQYQKGGGQYSDHVWNKEYLTKVRCNYFAGPGPRELEETSVSRSIIYQAGETANLPCDISKPKQNDELMLIMWYREDVRSPIYSIGKFQT